MHFIVSRAHLGQLISYLAKVGTFTVYWVIHDIMPRTGGVCARVRAGACAHVCLRASVRACVMCLQYKIIIFDPG